MDNELMSEWLKKVLFRLVKNPPDHGVILYGGTLNAKVEFDQEKCEEMLMELSINKENVLRYLKHKYKPTYVENGALFRDQKCIQKALIAEDKTLIVFIKNSEPHKIITDTIHVRDMLLAHGFDFDPKKLLFKIESLRAQYVDLLIYVPCLERWGFTVNSEIKEHMKWILFKFPKLEDVAKIKRRNIKRKYLRYFMLMGYITWEQLRTVIKLNDFSDFKIKETCFNIRKESCERLGKPIPI